MLTVRPKYVIYKMSLMSLILVTLVILLLLLFFHLSLFYTYYTSSVYCFSALSFSFSTLLYFLLSSFKGILFPL